MDMTVQDLIDLFTEPCEQLIEIYDLDSGETVFSGDAVDCPDEYQNVCIASLDPTTGPRLTINIGGEE